MGFANPVRPAPITVTVGGKDFFLWPGYPGEDPPPTFSGTTAYTRNGGNPCLLLGASGVLGVVSWPAYSREGPDLTKSVLVTDIRFQISSLTENFTFGFCTGAGTGTGPAVTLYGDNRFRLESNGVVGAITPWAGVALNTWHTLTMRAPGDVLVNGVLIGTLPNNAMATTAILRASSPSTTNSGVKVRNTSATWELP